MDAHVWMGSLEVKKEKYSQRLSPYDGRVASQAAVCDASDAVQALKIAEAAAKNAKKSPLHQRCSWLLDVASKLKISCEEFAKTLCDEVGKPLAYARIEVDRCIETITLTAETMRTMHGETINTDAMPSGRKALSYWRREPCGVVVAITPFNFPLNLVAHKLAPALVAGNAVVLKPTPEAPLCAYKLAKLFIESPHTLHSRRL